MPGTGFSVHPGGMSLRVPQPLRGWCREEIVGVVALLSPLRKQGSMNAAAQVDSCFRRNDIKAFRRGAVAVWEALGRIRPVPSQTCFLRRSTATKQSQAVGLRLLRFARNNMANAHLPRKLVAHNPRVVGGWCQIGSWFGPGV